MRLLPCPEAVEPALLLEPGGWPQLCSPTGRTEHPESTCAGADGGGHVLPAAQGGLRDGLANAETKGGSDVKTF